eukprot:CAMPEP_0119544480 /NCGR_PEP_ID=MMETSP1344-20130328/54754_1 /TAXON_ID=236787 /ORGANISM="Florenciella parvula, Strain CCMP2471" /LENGTH=131 /DNA_ID=CAMNT_0007588983 /DNA_START=260 /DNA_END=656 /DNA_ORIENTATION=-
MTCWKPEEGKPGGAPVEAVTDAESIERELVSSSHEPPHTPGPLAISSPHAYTPLRSQQTIHHADLRGSWMLLQVLLRAFAVYQAQGFACPAMLGACCCGCFYTMTCWKPEEGKPGGAPVEAVTDAESIERE